MKDTVSLKFNHEFRRLYAKGKSAVSPCVAVYCRKNRLDHNRLGLTVGTKVGKAVLRNRTRRRLREAYRLHEDQLVRGTPPVLILAGFSPARHNGRTAAAVVKKGKMLYIHAEHGAFCIIAYPEKSCQPYFLFFFSFLFPLFHLVSISCGILSCSTQTAYIF